jgi:hypothetical protein
MVRRSIRACNRSSCCEGRFLAKWPGELSSLISSGQQRPQWPFYEHWLSCGPRKKARIATRRFGVGECNSTCDRILEISQKCRAVSSESNVRGVRHEDHLKTYGYPRLNAEHFNVFIESFHFSSVQVRSCLRRWCLVQPGLFTPLFRDAPIELSGKHRAIKHQI